MVLEQQTLTIIISTLTGGIAGAVISFMFMKQYLDLRILEERENREHSQYLNRKEQREKLYEKELDIIPKLWEDTLHAVTVTHSLMKYSNKENIQEKLKEALSIQIGVSQYLRNSSIFLNNTLENHFDELLIKCNSTIMEINNNHTKDFTPEADRFRDECGEKIAEISNMIKEKLQVSEH